MMSSWTLPHSSRTSLVRPCHQTLSPLGKESGKGSGYARLGRRVVWYVCTLFGHSSHSFLENHTFVRCGFLSTVVALKTGLVDELYYAVQHVNLRCATAT